MLSSMKNVYRVVYFGEADIALYLIMLSKSKWRPHY